MHCTAPHCTALLCSALLRMYLQHAPHLQQLLYMRSTAVHGAALHYDAWHMRLVQVLRLCIVAFPCCCRIPSPRATLGKPMSLSPYDNFDFKADGRNMRLLAPTESDHQLNLITPDMGVCLRTCASCPCLSCPCSGDAAWHGVPWISCPLPIPHTHPSTRGHQMQSSEKFKKNVPKPNNEDAFAFGVLKSVTGTVPQLNLPSPAPFPEMVLNVCPDLARALWRTPHPWWGVWGGQKKFVYLKSTSNLRPLLPFLFCGKKFRCRSGVGGWVGQLGLAKAPSAPSPPARPAGLLSTGLVPGSTGGAQPIPI